MKLEQNFVLTPQVLGRLPGWRVIFPLDPVVDAVLVVTIEDVFELPFFNNLARIVVSFQDSTADVARLGFVDLSLAGEFLGVCFGAKQRGVEDGKNFHILGQVDKASAGVNLEDWEGTSPFVVTFLHGAIGLHVPRVNVDKLPFGEPRGVGSRRIGIILIPLGGLLCKGRKLIEDTLEPVGDNVGSVELSFLRHGEVWRTWGCRFGAETWVKTIVREEGRDSSCFRNHIVGSKLR